MTNATIRCPRCHSEHVRQLGVPLQHGGKGYYCNSIDCAVRYFRAKVEHGRVVAWEDRW